MTEEEKKEEKKVVKPGEVAGKTIDASYTQGDQEGGQTIKDVRWLADPDKYDYGASPGEGWVPMVDPGTGAFTGWQNPNIRSDVGFATRSYNPDGTLGPQSLPHEEKGQYGYGSKGKQKRLRIFSYVVKGMLGAMFGYGAGAALGAWGGAAAAGGEGAAGGLAAGEGALAGGEAALGGLGGVEPISTSGFTAAQGGIGSLGSGWGSSGVVAGEGGAGAAGTSAASSGMGWQDYVRQGMRMKDALSQGQQQQPTYAAGQRTIEQYQLPEDNIDERAVALRRATELRARIATLRSRLEEGA